MKVDIKKMVPIKSIKKGRSEDKSSLYSFKKCAVGFLEKQTWCKLIIDGYLGFGIPGIIGIFFFEIEPAYMNVDSNVWVVVGDLPSAYIATLGNPTPYRALQGYIREMKRWVGAVKKNEKVDDCIPVNVPPEMIYADMLEGRLNFLEETILTKFENELFLK